MAATTTNTELIGFKHFFPGTLPYCKEYYGAQVGKEKLRTLTCYFLGFFKFPVPSNHHMIRHCFSTANKGYAEALDAYNRNATTGRNYAILNVESLLRLYEWTRKAAIPETVSLTVKEEQYAETCMFSLMLLFNDEVLKDYQYLVDSINGSAEEYSLQKMLLAMSFSQNDLVNPDYAQLLYTQLYKLMELMKFIEGDPLYRPLYNALLKAYDVADKSELVRAFGAVVVGIIKSDAAGWTILEAAEEKDRAFLTKMAIEDAALFMQDDYLEIRNKPFEKISESEYRIIFDVFMIKKLYNGSYFKLLELSENDRSLFARSFAGSFKNDFSEGFLVYDVIGKIFPRQADTKIAGNDFKAVKMLVEPDYYVRTGDNKQLLFESKDFYVAGAIKASYDYPRIERELKKRLYKHETDGKTKNGAVLQLVTNVKRSLENNFILDKDYNMATLEIYPCMLVHDALYSAVGLNFEGNQWFNHELGQLKADTAFSSFDFSRIFPLTIIEIDTLILYQKYLSLPEHRLDSLIREFHAQVKLNFEGPYVSHTAIEQHVYGSVLPFSEFVRHYFLQQNIHPDMAPLSVLIAGMG